MFKKIMNKEKKDLTEPTIPNKKELLDEIRNNNCREIMLVKITLMAMEKERLLYPDKQEQIDEAKRNMKLKLKGLIIGIEVIDKELEKL